MFECCFATTININAYICVNALFYLFQNFRKITHKTVAFSGINSTLRSLQYANTHMHNTHTHIHTYTHTHTYTYASIHVHLLHFLYSCVAPPASRLCSRLCWRLATGWVSQHLHMQKFHNFTTCEQKQKQKRKAKNKKNNSQKQSQGININKNKIQPKKTQSCAHSPTLLHTSTTFLSCEFSINFCCSFFNFMVLQFNV
ncbi:unnamed protein product [Ceratitis capitata]|uniref:(Mediterranean fruit fly) hypothetical protein n=1 Tax=Ceratitis capitata TaxID=7213 RepID=A0A811VDP3_CERCA|nr:unnamed protein product [Ceratitis capitata]